MDADEIRSLIDSYTPSSLTAEQWEAVSGEVRSWVRAAQPGHPRRARQLLAAGGQLAGWCQANQIPLQVDTALRTTTIERYCAAAEADGRHSTTTRATVRSRLRYLASVHDISGQPPQPAELRRGRIKPPYTPAEVARYFQLIGGQPEPTASRLEALLRAGLGAGCGSEELRHLRGSDVQRAAEGMVLVQLQGRTQRTIPVIAGHAVRLAALAEQAGDTLLIGGVEPDRRAVASRLLQRLHGTDGLPPLEPGRLRSTWLADRLAAGVRLDVLMHAAGLTTPTTIVDLVAHLPAISTAVARRQLHADPAGQQPQAGSDEPRMSGSGGDCAPDGGPDGERA